MGRVRRTAGTRRRTCPVFQSASPDWPSTRSTACSLTFAWCMLIAFVGPGRVLAREGPVRWRLVIEFGLWSSESILCNGRRASHVVRWHVADGDAHS